MPALFIRTSKSGSNRTNGYASDISIKAFTPAKEVGDFAIAIDWKVDTGHKCRVALYNDEARKFLADCVELHLNSK